MTSARVVFVCAAALILALLAGCGGSSGQEKPLPKLAIKIEQFGPETQVGVTKNVAAGVQQASFTNKAKGRHSAQLIRYEPGHDPQEALKAAQAWGEHGKPLPSWIHLTGGFGAIASSTTRTGTVRLDPGSYMVVDIEATTRKPVYSTFEATGEPSQDALPGSPSAITAREYEFHAAGLIAGSHQVLFQNQGKQPHVVAAVRLAKGATFADVRKFAKTQKGKPPVEESTAQNTAIIDGGEAEVSQLDLKPGRYALLCFVSDRQGGPPHVAKGMIGEATVRR
jgi:hypothetical protein